MALEKRNQYIDFLKGVLMIIVVFGHAIQGANHGNNTNPTHIIIQSFQMCLFFMISGYVTEFSSKRNNYCEMIIRRINRLLIPYLCWQQIHFFSQILINRKAFSIQQYIADIYSSNFWFLRILFVLSVIYITFDTYTVSRKL